MNNMNVTGIDPAVDRFVFVHGPTGDSLDRSPAI